MPPSPPRSPLAQGVLHLRQVLPKGLLIALRRQIASALAANAGPAKAGLGIDRLAVAVHGRDPERLASLHTEFSQLPALYALALHPCMDSLLAEHCGWAQAALSPILNLRAKLPWRLSQSPFTTVPWHQDFGASDPSCGPVQLITAWIPLTMASSHHGGLELIPHSHQLGWLPHRRGERGPEVKPEAMAAALEANPELQPLALQARPGDVVLFDQLTLHRSLPNRSHRCRFSLDLRYTAAGGSSGRPGLWTRDPRVGEGFSPAVAALVEERHHRLRDGSTSVRKRVDEQP